MKRSAASDLPAAKRPNTGSQPKSILKKSATAATATNTKKATATAASAEAILRANTKANAKSTAAAIAAEMEKVEEQKNKKEASSKVMNKKAATALMAEAATTEKDKITQKAQKQPSSKSAQQPKAVLKLGGSAQRKPVVAKKPVATKKKAVEAGSDSENDGEDERDSDDDADGEESDDREDDDLQGIQAAASKKASKKNTEESMAEAMSLILGSTLRKADASQPILAKSRGIERKLEEERLEAKARKALTMEKKRAMNKDRVKPDYTGMEYEKKLRKVATRGVVQLFNAIKAQQKATDTITDKIAPIGTNAKDKVANMTKASFLDLLKSGTKVAAV